MDQVDQMSLMRSNKHQSTGDRGRWGDLFGVYYSPIKANDASFCLQWSKTTRQALGQRALLYVSV
jgi:hypothetical protein